MQLMAETTIDTFVVSNEDYDHEIDRAIQQWDLVVRPVYINEDTINKMREISEHFNVLKASVRTDSRTEIYNNVMAMITEIVSLGVLVDMAAWGLKYPDETDAGRDL